MDFLTLSTLKFRTHSNGKGDLTGNMQGNHTSMTDDASTFDPAKLLGYVFSTYEVELKPKDTILYALSLGFNVDPLKKDEYIFTYENA
jgi:hypothetical protein